MVGSEAARVDSEFSHVPSSLAGLGPEALSLIIESSSDVLIVLDATHGRAAWWNDEALAVLGAGSDGAPDLAPLTPLLDANAATVTIDGRILDGRVLDRKAAAVPGGTASLRLIRLRDVTVATQRARELRAFANTSASIAFAGDLHTVLDRLAHEVKHATGMYACTFLLMDGHTVLSQAGRAGTYPTVDDYAERLNQCTALGAPLLAVDAYEQRRPIVVEGWRDITLADPRFEPIHEFSVNAAWSSIAVVPLIVRDQIMGVLNGFYLAGDEPDAADLPFLSAIADQAAVAVENARLVNSAEAKAALEERHRLARELHDSVSQSLFSLTLQTRATQLLATAGKYERVGDALNDIHELANGTLAEMRALIFQLRPGALHEEGLVVALCKHAAAISARQEIAVSVIAPAERLPLAEVAESALFRFVQEALHNVVKHAAAEQATLEITADETTGDLSITITDDGSGFDPELDRPGHLGLTTMGERIRGLGGTLTITSTPHGTTVHAHLPNLLDDDRVIHNGGSHD